MIELSGTKELIFDAFVEMASTVGYENVSMREIARKVGIQGASIYNHFESKGKILEYAYDYYKAHLNENRKPNNEMKKIVETESAEKIIKSFAHTFESDDRKKYVRMILITKIVNMRMFQDPIAKAVFIYNDKNNIEYVMDVLKHGIDVGRIDPNFDIEIFADVLVSAVEIMGIKAFAEPTYIAGQIEKEPRILTLFIRLLSFSLLK